MQESILIKNVEIVLDKDIRQGDVFIRDGKIMQIAATINQSAELVLRGEGLTLLPGMIDTHVHFREPGLTHKEDFCSGSSAAVAGGVTSIIDMPNTQPAAISGEVIYEKKRLASQQCLTNYNFFIGATADNLAQLNDCENVAGIKLFLGSSTGNLLLDNLAALERIFANGDKLIAVHAELESVIQRNKADYQGEWDIFAHEQIRSAEAALKATQLVCDLARKYKRRLHILHVTSKAEVDYLAANKIAGLITAEVTPQHLLLASPAVYELYGGLAKVNPPIRGLEDRAALFKALKLGIIDTIASDHAPHTLAEKQQDFVNTPSGMPIIELSLPLLLNEFNKNKCSLFELVNWFSRKPAEIFGLKQRGQIKEGFMADLVLVDLKAKRKVCNDRLFTKAKWSVFENQELQGWPIITLVNGNMVYREGDVFGEIKGKELVLS